MRILVTGSAGFINGYVVDELLRAGHHVVGIDNYSKYGPVKKSYDDNPRYAPEAYDFVYEALAHAARRLGRARADAPPSPSPTPGGGQGGGVRAHFGRLEEVVQATGASGSSLARIAAMLDSR